LRKDIAEPFLVPDGFFYMKPDINMEFNEEPILMNEIADYSGREANSKVARTLWDNRRYGDCDQGLANKRLYGKYTNFSQSYVYLDKVCPTMTAKESGLIHFDKPKYLGQKEVCRVSSFPQDYNFAGQPPHYVCGMSVPPVMMAQVASRVYEQWLSKIKTT
jgi:DNA (cytosine-5)-methyltransferase 1